MLQHNSLVEEEKEIDQKIAHIIELGRKNGCLYFDDILKILPQEDHNQDNLDLVFAALAYASIPVYEKEEPPNSPGDNSASEDGSGPKGKTSELRAPLENLETDDLIGLYFRDAASNPLLNAQEEVDLARRIEAGQKARAKISSGIGVSNEKKEDLLDRIEDGLKAEERLLNSNARLVASIAKKYTGRGVSFLDLIQEGNIGLIRAAKKFDYKRGLKFSTYATWWIRQAVTRALSNQGRTIRIPVHMHDRLIKLFRTKLELRQSLEREPKVKEIAEAMKLSPKKVQFMLRIGQPSISLETPTTYEDDAVLGDFIHDEKTPDPDETASHNLLRQHLEQVFDEELPYREAQILKLRFGLNDGKTYTLGEAGDKLGLTKERIRQIESQALRKLRKPSIRRKFRDYLTAT